MQSHKLSRRRFLQPDGGLVCGVAAGHPYLFRFPELLHPGDRHDWGEGVRARARREGRGVRRERTAVSSTLSARKQRNDRRQNRGVRSFFHS